MRKSTFCFTRPNTPMLASVHSFFRKWRCKRICVVYSTLVLLALTLAVTAVALYTPARNVFLASVLPGPWQEVDTLTLVYIHRQSADIDVGVCPQQCESYYTPKARRSDVAKRGVNFYDDLSNDPRLYADEIWKFLPLLSRDEKTDLLYTLDVMVEALDSAGLEYFLVDGTLLGLVRHKGIIPWDDDIDVALDVKLWQKVMKRLCCVEGFRLLPKNFMHWKFFSSNGSIIRNSPEHRFPFIDLFFYMEDDTYIWSLTKYNIQNLLAEKTHVFPLTKAMLDGKSYAVPKDFEYLVQQQFKDMEKCVSPSIFHRFNHAIHGDHITSLPCKSLNHIYKFYA